MFLLISLSLNIAKKIKGNNKIMKRFTYKQTTRAIQTLSETLKEGQLSDFERESLLKAFNTLSDLIKKPKGINSAKRVDTIIGKVYIYFNEYNELVFLDSNKKQMFFLEDIDDGEEYDIVKKLEQMEHPSDLLSFSFCDNIKANWNLEELINSLNFETENPMSEIYQIGEYNFVFIY